MVGEKIWKIRIEKTALCERGKKRLSEAKDNLVVRIPLVVRFRPVVVQPQTILIVFNVEHVRVAVRVSLMHDVPSMSLFTHEAVN